MKLIVAGTYLLGNDYSFFERKLNKLTCKLSEVHILYRTGDDWGAVWADDNMEKSTEFEPNWKKEPKIAEYLANLAMIKQASGALLFYDGKDVMIRHIKIMLRWSPHVKLRIVDI